MVTHDVSRNPAICDLLELPYNEGSGCRPFPSPIKKYFTDFVFQEDCISAPVVLNN